MEAIYAGVMLTGPTLAEHLAGPMQLPGRASVDVIEPVRAARVSLIPMRERSANVQLRFRRQFTNFRDAARYVANFDGSLPDQGALLLRETGSGSVLSISYSGACIESWSPKRDGVGVIVECSFLLAALPTISESSIPDNEATLATWNEDEIEDLDERDINEPQVHI